MQRRRADRLSVENFSMHKMIYDKRREFHSQQKYHDADYRGKRSSKIGLADPTELFSSGNKRIRIHIHITSMVPMQ